MNKNAMIVSALKQKRASVQAEVDKIDAALSLFGSANGTAIVTHAAKKGSNPKLSAALREAWKRRKALAAKTAKAKAAKPTPRRRESDAATASLTDVAAD